MIIFLSEFNSADHGAELSFCNLGLQRDYAANPPLHALCKNFNSIRQRDLRSSTCIETKLAIVLNLMVFGFTTNLLSNTILTLN